MDAQELRNLQEAYLEVVEGKVEWDNPKRPLQSGLTPREKNRAVRKRLGIEKPDSDKPSFYKGGPSERDYERYGKLKAAHDTEKDKKVPDEKRHKFKSVAKGPLGGEHSAGRIKRMAGVHKGAEIGKNAEKGKGRYAVMSQTQGAEKVREKHKKRYGDYADLKRLKEPKESYDTNNITKMKTFQQFMEQHPSMKPNEYNKQVARASARWKGMQIRQAHGEMEHEAGAELAAKKARMKAIMSR